MLILRLCQIAVLWGLVGALTFDAWMTSVTATAHDSRVAWGLGWALGAWAISLAALALLRRLRPARWPRLGATRHGLALIVVMLCANALSHVAPDLCVRVLREEAPPLFFWLFPLVAGLTPLLLSSGARTRDTAQQALLAVTASTSLSGAIVFMDAPTAAWLGLLALALQLRPGSHRLPGGATVALAAAFVGLCITASMIGHNPIAARPALQWILALTALGAAVAVRPRDAGAWRDLLAASVLPAAIVAVCGALVTASLALIIAPAPALHTRLVLFREHPNFLAPYFGFHACLAAGLAAIAGGWRRAGWIAAVLLLIASTVLTDSRTGIAAMALALALVPGFYLLLALSRRLGLLRLGLLAVALTGLLAAGLAFGGAARLAGRLERFEASIDFRIDAWRNALLVIEQHPWIGVGPNTFLAIADFAPGSRFYNAREVPHPHNVPLYVGQSAGLPALAAFLGWVLAVMLVLWRRAAGGDDPVARPLLLASLAALIGLLTADLLDLGLAKLSVAPAPLFLLTGLAVAPRPGGQSVVTRPWHLLGWAAALVALALPFAVRPLLALGYANQGLLLTYEADQRLDSGLKRRALRKIEQAVELDPLIPELHGMLARWREQQPQGFPAAKALLESRIALAPEDGQGHSLLARLLLRLDLYDQAEPELRLALADPQGGPWLNRDRAALVHCVAEQGRRGEAVELLLAAMHRDLGVLAQLPWMDTPQPPHRLEVAHGADRPIELLEVADLQFQRAADSELAGKALGRAAWMDIYHTYRIAGRDDRAAAVLNWLESNGVEEVEDWTIAAERGELALSAGDPALAKQQFEQAVAIHDLPFHRQRLSQAVRELGGAQQAIDTVTASLLLTGEILDRPTDFRDNLDAKAASQIEHSDPGGAAESLRRTLIFHDDLLDRARLWEQIGDLELQAGRDDDCAAALLRAHEMLAAKPFPWSDLQLGLTDAVPMRIARTLTQAWRTQESQPRGRLHRAWGIPGFYSSRQAPSLFRLGFYAENGLTDQLLREAEIQLLADPNNILAHWMKLAALEAAYDRLDELPSAMRSLVEAYGRQTSAERQFNQVAGQMAAQPELQRDPEHWTSIGLLSLLRGRYAEAIGVFESGRKLLPPEDVAGQARIYGWEALAAHLIGDRAQALRLLEAGAALDPQNELLRQQLVVARGAVGA